MSNDTLGNVKGILMWGVIGFVVYEIWKEFSGTNPNSWFSQLTSAVGQGICSATSSLACAWEDLTFSQNISLNGNVVFPNGTQVALNSLPVANGGCGGVYVQYQGGTYQLNASNSCGNWPATQVS